MYHSMTSADDPWTFVKMFLKAWRNGGKGLWFWGFARQRPRTRHTVALLLPWRVHTRTRARARTHTHTHRHTNKQTHTAIALAINSTSWFVPPRKKQSLEVSCHRHLLSPTAWIAVKYMSTIFLHKRVTYMARTLGSTVFKYFTQWSKMHFPHH